MCSSILALKGRKISLMQLELQLAQVSLYKKKKFKLQGIGSLYEQ